MTLPESHINEGEIPIALISEPEPTESLSDDIIGVSEYSAEVPQKKEFLPWHRPRKQFVREMQWCDEIIKLVDEVLPENNILKYLGLPGDDLLDLRYFHEKICEPKNLRLRFLGFNNSATAISDNKTEFNISRDEVSKLDLVDPASDIIGDDICQLADMDSVAWNRATRLGPFDVINIDLCDGFGKVEPDPFVQTHYTALSNLLALQARRPHPWLLFLTTRCGSQHIHETVFSKLQELYQENLKSCGGFKEISEEKFSIASKEGIEAASKSEKGISDIFMVSLCKWIAKFLVGQAPPAKLEVKSVIGYKVYPKADHQDLVSIAIKIVPTLLPEGDPIGLATPSELLTKPNECEMALQVLKSVSGQINADDVLKVDNELRKKMIATTSDLLDAARYDVTSYAAWAESKS